MAEISDVFIMDVSNIIYKRDTKHCVCISVSRNKYFLINEKHRDIYEDFEIKASDYCFLKNTNRFVGCSKTFELESDRVIKKVGNLNHDDMMKILDTVIKSKTLIKMDKDIIIHELTKWLKDKV